MKRFVLALLICCSKGVFAYGGADIYESCKRYEQQRTPGYKATRDDALQVGMCLGMSKATYEMLQLSDSRSTGICLPEKELTPRDVALMFLQQMSGRNLGEFTATQAILGAFLAKYHCKGNPRTVC